MPQSIRDFIVPDQLKVVIDSYGDIADYHFLIYDSNTTEPDSERIFIFSSYSMSRRAALAKELCRWHLSVRLYLICISLHNSHNDRRCIIPYPFHPLAKRTNTNVQESVHRHQTVHVVVHSRLYRPHRLPACSDERIRRHVRVRSKN